MTRTHLAPQPCPMCGAVPPLPKRSALSPIAGATKPALILTAMVGVCAGLVFGGHELILWLEKAADLQRLAADAMLTHPAIVLVLVIYVVLLAVPFVPGAELGVFLLLVFGAEIAPIVYLATVAAMTLSYTVGRMVPPYRLVEAVRAVGLVRFADLLARHLDGTELAVQTQDLRTPWLRRLLRHRCVALAIAINTPGNTVLGGGGGLALAAGLSRMYSARAFVTIVALAVAPVPLGFVLMALLGA